MHCLHTAQVHTEKLAVMPAYSGLCHSSLVSSLWHVMACPIVSQYVLGTSYANLGHLDPRPCRMTLQEPGEGSLLAPHMNIKPLLFPVDNFICIGEGLLGVLLTITA